MMQTVIKIGNSAGIILPQDIRNDVNIDIGDKIEVSHKNDGIFLKKKRSPISLKFAKMVDRFMTEHADVLQELAHK